MESTLEHITTLSSESTSILPALITILIPLVCFAVVLLLLRFAAKTSWLTSIGASLVIATIPSIFGIRMFAHSPKIAVPVDASASQDAARILHYAPVARTNIGAIMLLPAAIGALLLVIQFFRWLLTPGTVQANVNTAERTRILKMVEEGTIQSEEGAELLGAMGRSSALQGQDAFTRFDIVMLIGVALVILGFFLPWANLGNRMYQAGHHRGPIGWAILIAAVLSAVPIFVTPKDLLYKISMLQIFLILVGLALVIKELSVGADQAGTIFCLAGFLIALLSSGFKLKTLAA